MRTWLLVAGIFACDAIAQTVPFEVRYKFGSLVPYAKQWDGPSVPLSAGGSARMGTVWFREVPDGVVILARVDGKQAQYARIPAETESRDHVSLWLAASADVVMPGIAWGNQFGLHTCREYTEEHPSGAEECASWQTRQENYREQLRRLFVRHWDVTPEFSKETYATTAYREVLRFTTAPGFAALEPDGGPAMAQANTPEFSCFEIFLKWADFPPVTALDLSSIYVAVEFCSGDGGCTSTAPNRKEGDPATFNRLELARHRVSTITRCLYPLEAADLFQNKYPAWYFPGADLHVKDTFALTNEYAGYRYDPEGLSPVPEWTQYFSKSISATETVCGPGLRYAAGKKVYAAKDGSLDEEHLAVRRLPNGAHLLKSGPTLGSFRPLGTGRCGACETASVAIYYVSPTTGVSIALQVGLRIDAPEESDGDIRVSPNWSIVTVFTAKAEYSDGKESKETWRFVRYCRSGTIYEECAAGPAQAPRKPRQVPFSTGGNPQNPCTQQTAVK